MLQVYPGGNVGGRWVRDTDGSEYASALQPQCQAILCARAHAEIT